MGLTRNLSEAPSQRDLSLWTSVSVCTPPSVSKNPAEWLSQDPRPHYLIKLPILRVWCLPGLARLWQEPCRVLGTPPPRSLPPREAALPLAGEPHCLCCHRSVAQSSDLASPHCNHSGPNLFWHILPCAAAFSLTDRGESGGPPGDIQDSCPTEAHGQRQQARRGLAGSSNRVLCTGKARR